jgi:hypothetical protein
MRCALILSRARVCVYVSCPALWLHVSQATCGANGGVTRAGAPCGRPAGITGRCPSHDHPAGGGGGAGALSLAVGDGGGGGGGAHVAGVSRLQALQLARVVFPGWLHMMFPSLPGCRRGSCCCWCRSR